MKSHPEFLKNMALNLLLHSLSNARKAHRSAEIDDPSDHRRAFCTGSDSIDE